ncbi:MAG: hypothetical protein WDW36_009311 [Sanguina aurantia]
MTPGTAITRATLYHQQTLAHIAASKGQTAVLHVLVDFITNGLVYIGAAAPHNNGRLQGIVTRSELLLSVLNTKNRKGRTPLMEACARGHLSAAEYLLSKASRFALRQARACRVLTPLLQGSEQSPSSQQAVWEAAQDARRSHDSRAPALPPCAVTPTSKGVGARTITQSSHTHPGTGTNHVGWYVDSRSWSGHVPLSCAIAQGHLEVMKLLLTHDPDINYASFYSSFMDDSVKCPAFSTPMHIAARIGSMEAAFELLLHFAQRPLMSELEDPRTLPDCNQKLPHEVALSFHFTDLHLFLFPGRELTDIFSARELKPVVMCSLARLAADAHRLRLLDDLAVAEAQEGIALVAAAAAAAAAAVAAAETAAAAEAAAAVEAANLAAAMGVTVGRAKAPPPTAFSPAVTIPGPSAWRLPVSPRRAQQPIPHDTCHDEPRPWSMTRRTVSSSHITQSLPSSYHADNLEQHLPPTWSASHQPSPRLGSLPSQRLASSPSPSLPSPSAHSPQREAVSPARRTFLPGLRLSPTFPSPGAVIAAAAQQSISSPGYSDPRTSVPRHSSGRLIGLHSRNVSLPGMASFDEFGSSSSDEDNSDGLATARSDINQSNHPSARVAATASSPPTYPVSALDIEQHLIRSSGDQEERASPTPLLMLPPMSPQPGWPVLSQPARRDSRSSRSFAIRSSSDIREVEKAAQRSAEEQQWSEVQSLCKDLPPAITSSGFVPSADHRQAVERLTLPRILSPESRILNPGSSRSSDGDEDDVSEDVTIGSREGLGSRIGSAAIPPGTADGNGRRAVVLAMTRTYNVVVEEETFDDSNLCDVCYDCVEQVEMDGCGHRLCRLCSSKIAALMQETPLLCPFCRTVVRKFTYHSA